MKRRKFLSVLSGGAVAWPFATHAQQALPVIGFLNPMSPETSGDRVRSFRQGLKEAGYVEGENVAVEYRWAEYQLDRLPALAADLVGRRVAVIAALGAHPPILAAKAATATIPIVFIAGDDPVRSGLVASLARPGGNLTGVNILSLELVAKRLELLRELVPAATRVAVLVNPGNPDNVEVTLRGVAQAARTMGLQTDVFNAASSGEIDTAFATLMRDRPDAVYVGGNPLFSGRRVQLALLAARNAVPAIYGGREYVDAGGLIGYGASTADAYRQVGVYVGRILKGAKPEEMPVVQASKFELVINAQTAKLLGLVVPHALLARADVVVE